MARQCQLGERNAPQPSFLRRKDLLGECFEAIEPDRLADRDQSNLGGATRGSARGWSRQRRSQNLCDGVGKTMQPILQLRSIQTEKNVEDMLRSIGIAHRKVGLQQIQSRGWTVSIG